MLSVIVVSKLDKQRGGWFHSINLPFVSFPKTRDKPGSWHWLFLYGESLLEVKNPVSQGVNCMLTYPNLPLSTENFFVTSSRSIICWWFTDSFHSKNYPLLKELPQTYMFFHRGSSPPLSGQCKDIKPISIPSISDSSEALESLTWEDYCQEFFPINFLLVDLHLRVCFPGKTI